MGSANTPVYTTPSRLVKNLIPAFPGGSVTKSLPVKARDTGFTGLTPGLGGPYVTQRDWPVRGCCRPRAPGPGGRSH